MTLPITQVIYCHRCREEKTMQRSKLPVQEEYIYDSTSRESLFCKSMPMHNSLNACKELIKSFFFCAVFSFLRKSYSQ